MSMSNEEVRKLYQYWDEHPKRYLEKVMGVKLKWYQKWRIKLVSFLKRRRKDEKR